MPCSNTLPLSFCLSPFSLSSPGGQKESRGSGSKPADLRTTSVIEIVMENKGEWNREWEMDLSHHFSQLHALCAIHSVAFSAWCLLGADSISKGKDLLALIVHSFSVCVYVCMWMHMCVREIVGVVLSGLTLQISVRPQITGAHCEKPSPFFSHAVMPHSHQPDPLRCHVSSRQQERLKFKPLHLSKTLHFINNNESWHTKHLLAFFPYHRCSWLYLTHVSSSSTALHSLVGRICRNAAVGASTVEQARYVPVLKISEACVECVLRSWKPTETGTRICDLVNLCKCVGVC